jgi:hypothetical protein
MLRVTDNAIRATDHYVATELLTLSNASGPIAKGLSPSIEAVSRPVQTVLRDKLTDTIRTVETGALQRTFRP